MYPEYDIIEDNRSIRPFGLNFNKKTIHEVEVSYYNTDIEKTQAKYQSEFISALTDSGASITFTENFTSDAGDDVLFTVRALCEVPIGLERRINIGEDNSISDS